MYLFSVFQPKENKEIFDVDRSFFSLWFEIAAENYCRNNWIGIVRVWLIVQVQTNWEKNNDDAKILDDDAKSKDGGTKV